MITRRELIKQASVLGSLSLLEPVFPLFSRYAQADVNYLGKSSEHLFVLIKILGGMDATLGLDPQIMPVDAEPSDLFLEYRPEDIIQAEGLRLGPAAKPLVPYAKDCLIVNGIMMRRDAGHDVCLQYMTTGRGDGKAALIPAELGLAAGFGPFGLVMNQAAYTAGKPVLLSQTADLKNEGKAGTLIKFIEEKLKNILPEGTPLEESELAIVNAKTTSQKLVALLDMYNTETGGKLTDAHVLAAAFESGASQQGVLDFLSIALDTHSGHEKTHLQAQLKVWENVAELFSLFKKRPYLNGTLFDHTTFMVSCEFSRTPALNSARGKDHNPMTNSILLAGKNILGGTTVGKSRVIPLKKSKTGKPEHFAWPFNYKEGKLAESPVGASFFYPENVVRTLSKSFGGLPEFTPISESVPIIPGISRV